MQTDRIIESLAAVGQVIVDEIAKGKKVWNPEANKYSRAINTEVLCKLIAEHLTHIEVFVLLSLIKHMDSENKVGYKIFDKLGLNRKTIYRTKIKLTEIGCMYEFPDGHVMINPTIALLTKYRKNCLSLKEIWTKAQKETHKLDQLAEQAETLL